MHWQQQHGGKSRAVVPSPAELQFARDPIDEIQDGSPIRPDIERRNIQDYWQDMLRQRQRQKPPAKKQQPPEKDKRPARGIDDFA